MELSVATANPDHDVLLIQVELDDPCAEHVPIFVYHLDRHSNVIQFNELSKSLIDSVTDLSLIVNPILEVCLGLLRDQTPFSSI